MTLKKITDRDLQGYGVIGMADTPNLSARQMQEKVEEVVRSVVIPAINRNIDYTASKQDLADAVLSAGAGDMAAIYYDTNRDGIVNKADNGFFIYTHSSNSLTGRGENGRFKATAAGTYTSFAVNGTSCAVKCGEDAEIELVDGAWYTFILDGNTINFKQGGAGLNFKIVGGTVQPASPKENTIWVNTDLEITGWAFDAQQPDNPETGNVWIKTGVNGNAPISAVKGKSLIIYPQSCMQWNGTEFISKDVKVYKNGQWITLKFWFLQGSEQYSGITGGWGAINTTGPFKSATADSSGLVFATTSYIARNIATIAPIDFTGINTLYFSIAACEFSGNAGNGYSMNMGVHTDRTVRWSVDSA